VITAPPIRIGYGPPPTLAVAGAPALDSEISLGRRTPRIWFQFCGFDLRTIRTSFEACAYRMAQAASFRAAAGLFQFRRRVSEEVGLGSRNLNLFSNVDTEKEAPPKKYRRQSFHASQSFPGELTIPWTSLFQRHHSSFVPPKRDRYSEDSNGSQLMAGAGKSAVIWKLFLHHINQRMLFRITPTYFFC